MITLDEALFDCQQATSDTTSDSQTKFMTWLNQGYQNVLATFGRPGIEKTINTTTNLPSNPLADTDRSYQLPPDALFPKTIKVQIGAVWYNLIEEESQEMWNYRTQYVYGGIPSEFFINDNFGVASKEVQIDPICTATTTTGTSYTPISGSESGATLTLTFSSMPFSIGQWVTLANFSLADGVNVNGNYQVATVVSNTITIIIPNGITTTITTMGTVTATVGVPMRMVYESSDVKLDHIGVCATPQFGFQTATASTLTFTYGSTTVTSTNPVFQSYMQLGSTYISNGDDGDGNWYKILQVNSSTSATIGNYYQGTTVSSATNWTINQIMSLHVDMQDIPEQWALYKYYGYKKDATWQSRYEQRYYGNLNTAKGNWATKTRSSIIRSKKGLSRWHAYPSWFPANGVTS